MSYILGLCMCVELRTHISTHIFEPFGTNGASDAETDTSEQKKRGSKLFTTASPDLRCSWKAYVPMLLQRLGPKSPNLPWMWLGCSCFGPFRHTQALKHSRHPSPLKPQTWVALRKDLNSSSCKHEPRDRERLHHPFLMPGCAVVRKERQQ